MGAEIDVEFGPFPPNQDYTNNPPRPALARHDQRSIEDDFSSLQDIPQLEDPRKTASHHSRSSSKDKLPPAYRKPSLISIFRCRKASFSRRSSVEATSGCDFLGAGPQQKRQYKYQYMLKLARSLIRYGAPTHRLEEYMYRTAESLNVAGQFVYLPGCMFCSIGDVQLDANTGAGVHIVKADEGEDMAKLSVLRHTFKDVVDGYIDPATGYQQLELLGNRSSQYSKLALILAYGLGSMCAGVFIFDARLIDLPPLLLLGHITGVFMVHFKQYIAMDVLFEVICMAVIAFLARAFGSLNLGSTFCFSALAQAPLIFLLPGHSMVVAMLEYQSRNVIAGTIRTIKVLLWVIPIALGMSLGTIAYGALNASATTATRCHSTSPTPLIYKIIAVALMSYAFSIEKQVKPSMAPAAIIIGIAGYTSSVGIDFVSPRLPRLAQIVAAFAIGVCSNLYSRLQLGCSAAVALVPLQLIVTGSFLSNTALLVRLMDADKARNVTRVDDLGGRFAGKVGLDAELRIDLSRVILSASVTMVTLGMAVAVGLLLAGFVVYPSYKQRRGLFGS